MFHVDQPLEEHSACAQPDHPKESATPNSAHPQGPTYSKLTDQY